MLALVVSFICYCLDSSQARRQTQNKSNINCACIQYRLHKSAVMFRTGFFTKIWREVRWMSHAGSSKPSKPMYRPSPMSLSELHLFGEFHKYIISYNMKLLLRQLLIIPMEFPCWLFAVGIMAIFLQLSVLGLKIVKIIRADRKS